jgi:hypothetical protein
MIISPVNPQAQTNGAASVGIYRINPAQTGAPAIPLIINRQLSSVTITSSSSPTPWTIDPERTQEIT